MITVPSDYASNIGGAMVERGARVISELRIVPAYLYQYAEAWSRGLAYDRSVTYWSAVASHDRSTQAILNKNGLLKS